MKFRNLFLLLVGLILIVSCGKYEFDTTQVSKEIALQQAKDQLGVDIDPNQDWKPIHHGSVTITANADLENIVKVQVLTESPFGNENAMILSSKDCQAGQQVTLTYEAPDYLTELVAACVNDRGVYYIKAFNIENQSVDFSKTANIRRRAASFDGYPSTILLGSSIKSFNAERAELSLSSPYKNVESHESPGGGGKVRWYTAWNDGSWANDRLWTHEKVEGDGGWSIENGTIVRKVSDEGDLETVKNYVNSYIKKVGGTNMTNGKANNWQSLATSNAYFSVNNNYVISNGSPVVLIPVQMNTTEGNFNTIYYYYYDPAEAPAGGEALANYIKNLPKFKAINGFRGSEKFKREKEYLLPYYGNNPAEGNLASVAIPKGYYIGFLNRKDYGNKGDVASSASGCIYGDGNLNREVNHLVGHYFTSLDKQWSQQVIVNDASGKEMQTKNGGSVNGMDWDSPRIGVFSANNRTYLCFEDGADLNFCDMIVEIKQGTEIIEETVAPKVRNIAYTMCFEDRPAEADYDMNDVVLTVENLNDTQINLTLFACGARDKVRLHGIEGSTKFQNQEIHEILGLSDDNPFLNTEIGGNTGTGVSEVITIGDKSVEEFLSNIFITNEVTGQTIRMSERGGAPNAIIVPMGFNYPKEGTNISKAYTEFLKWAQDVNTSKDWYRSNEGADRFPIFFVQ